MKEWKEYKYTELCTLIGGGTPKTSEPSFWGGDIPWLSVKDFGNGDKYVYSTEKTITDAGLNNSSTKLLQKDDIIISARGTIGAIAMLASKMAFNQSCFGIRSNELVDQHYLYYLTKTKITELQKNSHGSVFDTITRDTFAKVICSIPPVEEQKKIVSVLSSLDDKIEINKQINDNFVVEPLFEILLIWMLTTPINDNLEQQAQALFKSWFVDFEPFKSGEFDESDLGLIPKGWRIEKLGNICSCLLGGTPSRNKEEYWNGDIAWINSGEVNEFRITKPSEYITKEGLANSATKLLPKKSTVLAITGATLGQVSLLEIDSCANQSVIGVLENEDIPYVFIYPLINDRITELCSHMTGGAQQHINKNNVEQLDVIVPTNQILAEYKQKVEPIYSLISNNCIETMELAQLRDSLLSRLMTGELKLDEKTK